MKRPAELTLAVNEDAPKRARTEDQVRIQKLALEYCHPGWEGPRGVRFRGVGVCPWGVLPRPCPSRHPLRAVAHRRALSTAESNFGTKVQDQVAGQAGQKRVRVCLCWRWLRCWWGPRGEAVSGPLRADAWMGRFLG